MTSDLVILYRWPKTVGQQDPFYPLNETQTAKEKIDMSFNGTTVNGVVVGSTTTSTNNPKSSSHPPPNMLSKSSSTEHQHNMYSNNTSSNNSSQSSTPPNEPNGGSRGGGQPQGGPANGYSGVNGANGGDGLTSQQQPRTIYIGNLDPNVTEELLVNIFSHLGGIQNCKIIHEPGNDPYAFIEFMDYSAAAQAVSTMNKRNCLGRELKVNWATSPNAAGSKPDTSKHYHIFVGDLSPEIETSTLREAFSPFGEISDCRVVRDPQTLKSKGYGFVSFVKKQDAENAIGHMNGQYLGSRAIRTNWATRKPPTGGGRSGTGMPYYAVANGSVGGGGGGSVYPGMKSNHHNHHPNDLNNPNQQYHHHPSHHSQHHPQQPLTFDEVYHQSSPTNCTVYCGGIMQGLSEELISKTFSPFGQIQEIRVFKDKGYAFVKFSTKEMAASAIVNLHNSEINGQTVKCSWGKESGDPNNQAMAAALAAAGVNPMALTTLGAAAYGTPSVYAYPHQGAIPPPYWYSGYSIQGQPIFPPAHPSAPATYPAAAYGHQAFYGTPAHPQASPAAAGGPSPGPNSNNVPHHAANPHAAAAMMNQHHAAMQMAAWQAAAASGHVPGVNGQAMTPANVGGNGASQNSGSSGQPNSISHTHGAAGHPPHQAPFPLQQQQQVAAAAMMGYMPPSYPAQ